MAFSAGTLWRVRSGGASNNGGGFDPTVGSPGTNYTIQNSPQITYTDMVIDVTTNTNFTSAANPVTSAHVGNVINVTSGTGFTVQRVVIVSQSGGVATCDKSLGTLGSTGGNGRLGGAFADLVDGDGVYVAGNTVYVEAGTYTRATARTLTCDGSAAALIRFIGCAADASSPADEDLAEASMPILTTVTNSITKVIFNTVSYLYFRNIKVTDGAGTKGAGWDVTGGTTSTNVTWINCVTDGCTTNWVIGFNTGSTNVATFVSCISRNATSATNGGFVHFAHAAGHFIYINCISHNNAADGWLLNNNNDSTVLIGCLAYDNTRDGIRSGNTATAGTTRIDRCTFYSNGGNGVHFVVTSAINRVSITNSIFVDNVYGIGAATASVEAGYLQYSNAFYNNSSGLRSNVPTGINDITLTASPFVNPTTNFALNMTAGGGLSCRNAGLGSVLGVSGGTTRNSLDLGAAQSVPGGSFVFGS